MSGSRNNICLIGYMGSGKSTVGKVLAERFGMTFEDTDEIIVKSQGRSIPEIFREEGEPYFRELEHGLVQSLAKDEQLKDTVLSTGGGIIINEDNRKLLKRIGCVVYLRACAQSLYERVKGDEGRPLLNTEDVYGRIEEMLKQRSPMYEEAADHIIDTDGLSVDETVMAVAAAAAAGPGGLGS